MELSGYERASKQSGFACILRPIRVRITVEDHFLRFAASLKSEWAVCFDTSVKSPKIILAILTTSRCQTTSGTTPFAS